MKILLALFVSCLNCFSQNSKNIIVEYQIFNNTESPNTLYATLYSNTGKTIYLEKYSTKVNTTEDPEGVISRPPLYVLDSYTKIDHTNKKTYFFESIKAINYLIEDSYIKHNWEITKDTKDIAGYTCIKAITNFRGREWTAWFAPEIPVTYGPWKLHGLPGLILESYDSTNRFRMQAVKIEFKDDPVFNKDFKMLCETKNDTPVSYQEYLKMRQEYFDNTKAEIMQEHKNMTFLPTPSRSGKELKFEWEQ